MLCLLGEFWASILFLLGFEMHRRSVPYFFENWGGKLQRSQNDASDIFWRRPKKKSAFPKTKKKLPNPPPKKKKESWTLCCSEEKWSKLISGKSKHQITTWLDMAPLAFCEERGEWVLFLFWRVVFEEKSKREMFWEVFFCKEGGLALFFSGLMVVLGGFNSLERWKPLLLSRNEKLVKRWWWKLESSAS